MERIDIDGYQATGLEMRRAGRERRYKFRRSQDLDQQSVPRDRSSYLSEAEKV